MSTYNGELRVLHVIPTLGKGGAERLCLDIVRELAKRGDVQTMLICLRGHNAYAEEYSDLVTETANASVVPSITGEWKINLSEYENLVSRFNPHIIHSHLYESEIVVHTAVARDVKYFMHCHQNTPQLHRPRFSDIFSRKRIYELYERRFLLKKFEKCGKRFFCISTNTQRYFKSNLPKGLKNNTLLLPNALDHGRFSSKTAHGPKRNGKVKLITVGRLIPKKNHAFLLHVVRELHRRGINAGLTIIGEGEERNKLKERIGAMQLNESVTMPGNLEHIEAHLWEHHIYVHSAIEEAFGLVIAEAMAAGLPVVSLDGGGNRDLITEGETGFMLDIPDHVLFADRIEQLINSPELYTYISKNASAFSAKYDIVKYCDDLIHNYRN